MPREEASPLEPDDKSAVVQPPNDLPKLRAPAPRLSRDEPLSGPVTLSHVDPSAAKEALRDPLALASSLYPEVDAERVALVTNAAIDRINSRAAAGLDDAVSSTELGAIAGIGDGVEDLLVPELTEFAQVVVRGTFAKTQNRIFYEELESLPATIGRRYNGEGSEKVPGIARNQLHFLQHSVAGSSKHCPLGSRPLNLGTRWARSNERFGNDFPGWALERMDSFPDSFSEHVKTVLADDRKVRGRAIPALREGQLLLPGQITEESLVAAISRYLLIGPVAFGTSLVPHRSQLDTFKPGRDPATVRESDALGRSVALACGAPTLEERLEFEEESEILQTGELPSMYELGIRHAPEVQYRWSPSRHQLMRYAAGEGSRIELWRLLGVEKPKHFWRTLTMIERHSQVTWTTDCTLRYEAECLPGKLQAHLPEQCAGLRAFLDMANSGIVDAIRSSQSREN